MNRASTSYYVVILKSINSASISGQPLGFDFVTTATFSSLSSLSLQTLTDIHQTKSIISNPLQNLLPHAENPNNLVNIITSSLKQHEVPSLPLLHKHIQGLLPHLGTPEISRVLLRCQSDPFTAMTFFNWVKNDLGLKPDTRNYCLIVHILAWSRNYTQAMKLLSELIELKSSGVLGNIDIFQDLVLCTEECSWDQVVFDMLVKAYVKAGMIREGFRAFRKTVKFGIVPNVVAINCLLNGLSKSNYTDKCWEIYEEMGRIGIHPNSYTFNILTHVLCKVGDVDKVKGFLDKMEEEGFDPDIVTYNTLIDNYCKRGRMKDAHYLYHIMYRRGIMPDLVSYTALINGLCKERNVKDARDLFHHMVHIGLSPDVVTYNTLICGYCKEGMMEDARSLLHDMVGNRICPDSFTCWILIEGYAKEDRLLSSLNLIVELQRFGVSISPDIYNYLVAALCRENRPFAAKSLFERMLQDGHGPNVDLYSELIGSLCKCNYVEEALLLKAEMCRCKDVKPNVVIFSSIISPLCRLNRSMEAEALMREMVEFGLLPDMGICRALIKGYCNELDICKAESLLCFFAKEFQIFDSECYNALVRVLWDKGDINNLMEFQDRMLKVGFVPDTLTFKYMIDGLSRGMGVDTDSRVVL